MDDGWITGMQVAENRQEEIDEKWKLLYKNWNKMYLWLSIMVCYSTIVKSHEYQVSKVKLDDPYSLFWIYFAPGFQWFWKWWSAPISLIFWQHILATPRVVMQKEFWEYINYEKNQIFCTLAYEPCTFYTSRHRDCVTSRQICAKIADRKNPFSASLSTTKVAIFSIFFHKVPQRISTSSVNIKSFEIFLHLENLRKPGAKFIPNKL